MENLFFLKVTLSFLLGGAWVVFATVLADKYGSKIGGLISGLPSTAIFSLFFLAWTQNPSFSVAATTVMPVGLGIENIYILIFILLVSRGLWLALASALATWFLLALGLVVLKFDNYVLSLVIYGLSFLFTYLLLEKDLHIKSILGRKIIYSPKIILTRGLLAGTIVAISVVVGRLGGPIFGGLGAVFPAIVTSTMIITYFAHGSEFSAGTMKSAVPGLMGLAVYSAAVRFTFLPLGMVWGTLVSALASFFGGYLIYHYLVKKTK